MTLAAPQPQTSLLEPTVLHYFPAAVHSIYACLFGKPTGDWAIKTREQEVAHRVARFAFDAFGATEILAPVLDFSARICTEEQLSTRSIEVTVPRCEKVKVMRGAKGDIIALNPGQAGFLTSGDCPPVILWDPLFPSPLFCAHAGRDCLFDKSLVLTGKKSREYGSVVDVMMNFFEKAVRPRLKAFIMCGIASKNFMHPWKDATFGEQNIKMTAHLQREYNLPAGLPNLGCIPLKVIIREQLLRYGVDPDNIGQDTIDTHDDLEPGTSNPLWWSYRRGDRTERNGILIAYK